MDHTDDTIPTMQAVMDLNANVFQARQQNLAMSQRMEDMSRRMQFMETTISGVQDTQNQHARMHKETQDALLPLLRTMQTTEETRTREASRKRRLDDFVAARPLKELHAVCGEVGIRMYKNTRKRDFADKLLPFFDTLHAAGKL
jgi:hypothetical protein